MSNRDDFAISVKEVLANRVGLRCSNPGCRQLTAGPKTDPARFSNIGVGAHITAATERGPRYDKLLSAEQRSAANNGIWLCQNCAKLIDNDVQRYTVELLQRWKDQAEQIARDELEGARSSQPDESANLTIDWKKIKLGRERHEYLAEILIHNVGAAILRHYHVDVEFPTIVLTNRTAIVADRSNEKTSVLRIIWRNGQDDIFPGDSKVLIAIPYFVDDDLYYSRGDLFDRTVRATLYFGDRRQAIVEMQFNDLQCF